MYGELIIPKYLHGLLTVHIKHDWIYLIPGHAVRHKDTKIEETPAKNFLKK